MEQKSIYGNQTQAVQIAYLAGIYDGEGTIRINKCGTAMYRAKHKTINPTYIAHLCLGMIDKRIPELLCKVFGGHMRYERAPEGKNCRGVWRWESTGRQNVTRIVTMLYPYLIVKKAQADVVLDLCNNWETPYSRSAGVGQREILRREQLYQKMKKLNAVGGAALSTEREDIREGETTVSPAARAVEDSPKSESRQLYVVGQ